MMGACGAAVSDEKERAMPKGGGIGSSDLVSALSRALREANRYLAEQLDAAGLGELSPSHGDILAQLFAEEPLAMQDLARAIHRDPSTVTALVRKLAAAGYVETSKSLDDGRVMLVALTDEGRALEPVFERISASLVRTQMQGIDARDLEATRRTLGRIEDNFTKALGDEGRDERGSR